MPARTAVPLLATSEISESLRSCGVIAGSPIVPRQAPLPGAPSDSHRLDATSHMAQPVPGISLHDRVEAVGGCRRFRDSECPRTSIDRPRANDRTRRAFGGRATAARDLRIDAGNARALRR